jgi:four helix bundle protein
MSEVIMNNEQFKIELEERTLVFTLNVLEFLYKLPNEQIYWVLINQLSKAATSIGANYRDANRSESRSDFVHKIGIVEKESSETEYWLKVLSRLSFLDCSLKSEIGPLHTEAVEFVKLFTTINRNAKKKTTRLMLR